MTVWNAARVRKTVRTMLFTLKAVLAARQQLFMESLITQSRIVTVLRMIVPAVDSLNH